MLLQRFGFLGLLALLLLGLAAPAQAQLVEEAHPELGLTVTRPRSYKPLPVPPRERILRLSWVQEGEGERPASISIGILEGDSGPRTTEAYLADYLGVRDRKRLRGGARRYGMDPVRFEYKRVNEDGHRLQGLVLGWESRERCVLVVAESLEAQFRAESKRWFRVADTLRMTPPRVDERERNKWERHYAKGRYQGEAKRIEERLILPENWSAKDTLDYLVLAHIEDDLLLRRVATELTGLRKRLERDLPSVAGYEQDTVSIVRICADREEYLAYGGLPRAVGYFSPLEAELVLYVGPNLEQTFQTLYHEAFHQYIYHSSGGVSPDPWFDEGMGEFYAGSRFDGGRVSGIEPLKAHLFGLRQALEQGTWTPLQDLVRLDQKAYYANPALHYAQGWSLLYFLREVPAAKNRPLWGGIPDRYYRALAKAWSEEVERARPQGFLDVAPARARALGKAAKAAYEGVDPKELGKAWEAWIRASE